MKRIFKLSIIFLTAFGFLSAFTSCKDTGDEPEIPVAKERLVLIYAIAANNLEPNLKYDLNEILQGASQLDLSSNCVLVYSVVNSGRCVLQKLQKNKLGLYEFEEIQEFPDLPLSTDQERIHDVIEYVVQNYDYEKYGLVLWSHADGWLPWFAGSNPQSERKRSFGWDNFGGATYKTNITELADAIPDNVFDYIWFDCCYMANIETVYQLRNKADYIVGSVLEIASDGMPYDLTMPYLVRKEAELEKAAFAFFSYYDTHSVAVSISIMDTKQLDQLADAAREIFETCSGPTNFYNIQTYQRNLSEKFYDMGQLLESYSPLNQELKSSLASAFSNAVIYKLISDYDFNHRPINVKDYSGLSMHNYEDNNTGNNLFYRELDWFKATR